MKYLFALSLLAFSVSSRAEPLHTFGIHLFFNEKEFVDTLYLVKAADGTLHGTMNVPNDFEGSVENLTETATNLVFDLPVPKNATRPAMVFHYEGRFFDAGHRQLTGFVTMKGTNEFVAAFVGFPR
jgi:hypothetical protein